jgi:uncharacterized HAD superfamily protein
MKIAIDLDDVTVSIVQELTDYYNKMYNTAYTFQDYQDYDLSIVWKCSPEEAMKRVYAFYHSDLMDTLAPVSGAVAGISTLLTQHDVTFVTSRPPFLEEKTKRWIETYFPGKQLPVYFTNQYAPPGSAKQKKSDVCKYIGARLIIEDSPIYAYDCSQEGIDVLLFERPWNTVMKVNRHIHKMKSWEEIVKYIQSRT